MSLQTDVLYIKGNGLEFNDSDFDKYADCLFQNGYISNITSYITTPEPQPRWRVDEVLLHTSKIDNHLCIHKHIGLNIGILR